MQSSSSLPAHFPSHLLFTSSPLSFPTCPHPPPNSVCLIPPLIPYLPRSPLIPYLPHSPLFPICPIPPHSLSAPSPLILYLPHSPLSFPIFPIPPHSLSAPSPLIPYLPHPPSFSICPIPPSHSLSSPSPLIPYLPHPPSFPICPIPPHSLSAPSPLILYLPHSSLSFPIFPIPPHSLSSPSPLIPYLPHPPSFPICPIPPHSISAPSPLIPYLPYPPHSLSAPSPLIPYLPHPPSFPICPIPPHSLSAPSPLIPYLPYPPHSLSAPSPLISGSSQDSFSQLAAPQHLHLLLYNDEQILIDALWVSLLGPGGGSDGAMEVYVIHWSFFVCNSISVTIGPPKNISVTPGKGSLIIHFSPPFDVTTEATFKYHVHYWEKTGTQQVSRSFKKNSIVLHDLKPVRVYCLQIETQLTVKDGNTCRPRFSFSNVSCHETTANTYTRLQVILIPVGIFLSLLVLTGAGFILFLKYQSRVKYWFQAPPNIPEQIKEYLKDPDQPILEVLDKDSSPKDDAWDSVSIISSPEKEHDGVLRTL
ncbi:Interferon gamma receptor 2 [Lemmus lemmus]